MTFEIPSHLSEIVVDEGWSDSDHAQTHPVAAVVQSVLHCYTHDIPLYELVL